MTKLKSAIVSGILIMILAMASYIIGIGDVFKVDGKVLLNTGVIAILTAIVSLIKSAGTTEDGTFVGIKVK